MSSPNVLSKAFKRNLHKKDLCVTKKTKIERSDSSIINEKVNSNIIVNQADKRENIFYNPLKISEDFFSSDLKSAKTSQPYTLINPKFTFVKKFLERRQQRLFTSSLPPQIIQPIPINNSEIPIYYMTLL
ncbi:5706_t:CDS:2, partial [Racocetra persica]